MSKTTYLTRHDSAEAAKLAEPTLTRAVEVQAVEAVETDRAAEVDGAIKGERGVEIKDDAEIAVKGEPIVAEIEPAAPAEVEDTSIAMVVGAWKRLPVYGAPDKDGNPVLVDPGEKADGVFVLRAEAVAALNGRPLQLPPGIVALDRLYMGMAEPLPGAVE